MIRVNIKYVWLKFRTECFSGNHLVLGMWFNTNTETSLK